MITVSFGEMKLDFWSFRKFSTNQSEHLWKRICYTDVKVRTRSHNLSSDWESTDPTPQISISVNTDFIDQVSAVMWLIHIRVFVITHINWLFSCLRNPSPRVISLKNDPSSKSGKRWHWDHTGTTETQRVQVQETPGCTLFDAYWRLRDETSNTQTVL